LHRTRPPEIFHIILIALNFVHSDKAEKQAS